MLDSRYRAVGGGKVYVTSTADGYPISVNK